MTETDQSASQSEIPACSHCAQPLPSEDLSKKYSVCLKCKSCGGYSAVKIQSGKIQTKPIATSAIKTTVATFMMAGGLCTAMFVFFVIDSFVIIRTHPEFLAGFVPAILLTFAMGYLFITKALVTLYGNPSFRITLFRKAQPRGDGQN